MEKVTISQLKDRLSAYLRKVRAGHSLLILDREQPVAVLEPVSADKAPDDKLARLERAGLLRRSKTGRPLDVLRNWKAPKTKRSVVDALLDERRDSR